MYYFCTYFDSNYLPKALCLLDSLERHCASFRIYILCLDEDCLKSVKALKRDFIDAMGVAELEKVIPQLTKVKDSRSASEYYYTCGPAFIRYVLDFEPAIDIITYLDADLYFFSDPGPLFEAFKGYSIGVVGNHMPEFRKKRVWQGFYNVGWINFRRDADGLSCLEWWRDRCLEWCYERYEDGKFADQLYLDQWPKLFKGFIEFTHHGANVAPWNAGDYRFAWRNGQIYVDEYPIIYYHFHGLIKVFKNVYNTNLGLTLKAPNPIVKHIYSEYIKLLEHHSVDRNPTASIRRYRPKYYVIKSLIRFLLGLIFRQYIVVKSELSDAK